MGRRMFTDQGHYLAQIDDAFAVQGQRFNRNPTRLRQAHEERVILVPSKVFVPIVPAWMVKWNGFSSGKIKRENFVVFAAVAALTSQRQIVFSVLASSRKGNNVFHGKSFSRVRLPTETVFAIPLCALSDQVLQFLREPFSSHADKV